MPPLKGRHWVVLWLALFLLVAVIVETRQLKAFELAKQLGDLRNRRRSLDATRAELVRQVTEASSRAVLMPKAESLGLHVPTDAEETLITPPPVARAVMR